MSVPYLPLRVLLLTVSTWVHHQQHRAIESLRIEICIVEERQEMHERWLKGARRRRARRQHRPQVPQG